MWLIQFEARQFAILFLFLWLEKLSGACSHRRASVLSLSRNLLFIWRFHFFRCYFGPTVKSLRVERVTSFYPKRRPWNPHNWMLIRLTCNASKKRWGHLFKTHTKHSSIHLMTRHLYTLIVILFFVWLIVFISGSLLYMIYIFCTLGWFHF